MISFDLPVHGMPMTGSGKVLHRQKQQRMGEISTSISNNLAACDSKSPSGVSSSTNGSPGSTLSPCKQQALNKSCWCKSVKSQGHLLHQQSAHCGWPQLLPRVCPRRSAALWSAITRLVRQPLEARFGSGDRQNYL